MDRYLHCSSVAVLQHNEKSVSTDRVNFSADDDDFLTFTLPGKHTRDFSESRGKN